MDTMLVLTTLSIIIAIISVFITYKAWKKKKLSYAILVDTHPIKVSHGAAKTIRMTFMGREVKNVRLVELKIWNSGNDTIETSDYSEPITLLPPIATKKTLHAIITKREPENLPIAVYTSPKNYLALTPVLMNPGDVIYISLLINDYDKAILPEARISGVKKIAKDYPTVTSKFMDRTYPIFAFIIWAAVILNLIKSLIEMLSKPLEMSSSTYIGIPMTIFGIFLLSSVFLLILKEYVLRKFRKVS